MRLEYSMFLEGIVQEAKNIKNEIEHKIMLSRIQKNQISINESQNLLLEKLTFVLNLSTNNQESTEKLNPYFDDLVLMYQKIENIKFKLSIIKQFIQQMIHSIQQGRAIYFTLLLEQANIFKQFMDDFQDRNKSTSSAQLLTQITQSIDKNSEFIKRLEKNMSESLSTQESFKTQVSVISDNLSKRSKALLLQISSLQEKLSNHGIELEKVLLQINDDYKNSSSQIYAGMQKNAEIYKYLSALENSMRLTVANQLLNEADRAVTTIIALNYDKNDFESCKRAAELGNVEAMYNLGLMYLFGELIESNAEEGFQWVKQAADKEFSDAIYVLAGLYSHGIGTNENNKKAFELYKKISELGDPNAMYSLAQMYLNGDGVTEDQSQAFKWFKESAEAGNANAMNMLGRCYYDGWGVSINKSKAVDYGGFLFSTDN